MLPIQFWIKTKTEQISHTYTHRRRHVASSCVRQLCLLARDILRLCSNRHKPGENSGLRQSWHMVVERHSFRAKKEDFKWPGTLEEDFLWRERSDILKMLWINRQTWDTKFNVLQLQTYCPRTLGVRGADGVQGSYSFYLFFSFYWSVDLQYCGTVCCTAELFSYTHSFSYICPDIVFSFLLFF